jgi:hypothetical protein
MQNVRYEGSVLSSLEELKKIEEDRVAEEQAAVAKAAEAKRLAHEAAMQKAREEAEAKVQAEHEARMALERARLDADREARLRVEATDAAERARAAVALEETRLAGELDVRRAEAARTRPTWMVAVTIGALALAGAMGFVTMQARNAADEADRNAQLARADASAARTETGKAIEDMKALGIVLADVTTKIESAIKRVDAAKKADEIAAAAAEAKRLKDIEIKKALDAAAAAKKKWDDERKGGVKGLDPKCLGAAICKEAMQR